jgi:hypothetical protein
MYSFAVLFSTIVRLQFRFQKGIPTQLVPLLKVFAFFVLLSSRSSDDDWKSYQNGHLIDVCFSEIDAFVVIACYDPIYSMRFLFYFSTRFLITSAPAESSPLFSLAPPSLDSVGSLLPAFRSVRSGWAR